MYVKDLKNPDSENIAAIHYKYRWIEDNHCYKCHTDYGLFGTAKAKMSGIRNIWSYYVVGYEIPIKIRGTYNNQICLRCHGPVEDYQDVDEQKDYLKDLELNKESCFGEDCHKRGDVPTRLVHDRNYIVVHTVDARANPRTCGNCHEITFCNQCHREGGYER